jgi:DNA-binding MarR family transcriptional regulator
MGPDLENAISEITIRMRLFRALQEEQYPTMPLTEREVMILELLDKRGKMSISEIAASIPKISDSTISTSVTKLWRDKHLVSKTISPDNQRTTIVELTGGGKKAIDTINKQRAERFKALFQALEVSDSEKEVFINILNRMIPFFDKYLGLDKRPLQ